MRTLDAVHGLIAERIHPGFNQRLAHIEARKVARLYIEARNLPEDMELQDVDENDIVRWVRGLGYQLMNHPCPPYWPSITHENKGEWTPKVRP